MIYEVELRYQANITKCVEANDEGEALAKAREKAEEADLNEFTIVNELESRIVSTR